MKAFDFWQKWLFTTSVIVAVFGLALAFFNHTPLFDALFNDHIDPQFWGGAALTPESLLFQRWIYGVLGATVAGWGVLLAFLARTAFRKRERWAWNGIAGSMLLWYLLDTAISLQFRVTFNAAFNTLLLVLVALPLAFTRRYFSPDSSKHHHHHSPKGTA
ncbi:MAG: hypothetical protein ACOYYU_01030 [Chloroflexota bacterium]